MTSIEQFQVTENGDIAFALVESAGIDSTFKSTRHDYTLNDHPVVTMDWSAIARDALEFMGQSQVAKIA